MIYVVGGGGGSNGYGETSTRASRRTPYFTFSSSLQLLLATNSKAKFKALLIVSEIKNKDRFLIYGPTTLFLILYRRQVVEGVTECTLDYGELPKGNYLPPVQY